MPTPIQIASARVNAGLSCAKAASLIQTNARVWIAYENGSKHMPEPLWELVLKRIKSHQRGTALAE